MTLVAFVAVLVTLHTASAYEDVPMHLRISASEGKYFTKEENTGYPEGNLIIELKRTGVEDCKRECLVDSTCVGFTYFRDGRDSHCELKSALPAGADLVLADADTYVKEDFTATNPFDVREKSRTSCTPNAYPVVPGPADLCSDCTLPLPPFDTPSHRCYDPTAICAPDDPGFWVTCHFWGSCNYDKPDPYYMGNNSSQNPETDMVHMVPAADDPCRNNDMYPCCYPCVHDTATSNAYVSCTASSHDCLKTAATAQSPHTSCIDATTGLENRDSCEPVTPPCEQVGGECIGRVDTNNPGVCDRVDTRDGTAWSCATSMCSERGGSCKEDTQWDDEKDHCLPSRNIGGYQQPDLAFAVEGVLDTAENDADFFKVDLVDVQVNPTTNPEYAGLVWEYPFQFRGRLEVPFCQKYKRFFPSLALLGPIGTEYMWDVNTKIVDENGIPTQQVPSHYGNAILDEVIKAPDAEGQPTFPFVEDIPEGYGVITRPVCGDGVCTDMVSPDVSETCESCEMDCCPGNRQTAETCAKYGKLDIPTGCCWENSDCPQSLSCNRNADPEVAGVCRQVDIMMDTCSRHNDSLSFYDHKSLDVRIHKITEAIFYWVVWDESHSKECSELCTNDALDYSFLTGTRDADVVGNQADLKKADEDRREAELLALCPDDLAEECEEGETVGGEYGCTTKRKRRKRKIHKWRPYVGHRHKRRTSEEEEEDDLILLARDDEDDDGGDDEVDDGLSLLRYKKYKKWKRRNTSKKPKPICKLRNWRPKNKRGRNAGIGAGAAAAGLGLAAGGLLFYKRRKRVRKGESKLVELTVETPPHSEPNTPTNRNVERVPSRVPTSV